MIGKPLLLGPSTSGLWILLTYFVFISSGFIVQPRKTRKELGFFTGCIGAIFIIWVLYLTTLGVISFSSKNEVINFHPLLFALCLLPTFLYLIKYQFKERTSETLTLQTIKLKKILKNGTVWAAIFLFLSSILLTTFVNAGVPPAEHKKVVFYGQHMLGTWDIPAYGKYGRDAAGMFGLWPIYLTNLGYETQIVVENKTLFLNATQPPSENITRYINLTDYVSVIESPEITRDILKDTTAFVVTNLNTSFSQSEKTIIWEFVEQGGSLLVLGDHTNVGGMQTPLNELLTPVGISFRFDAALPLDQQFKWLTCYQLLSHPITAHITNLDELQLSVGASLNISTSSFPVIIGKYALSDKGNWSNADLAYLGDYEYNNGEQLGDIILVAGAYYGDGKVLVFGDTSSFQNPAHASSFPFLQSVFSWLNSEQTATIEAIQIGFSLLFLIGAVIAFRFFKNNTLPFVVFPVILCAALLVSATMNPLLLTSTPMTGNVVVIDASHNERFTLESFTDDSVNGLIVNFQRNNYLPILLQEFALEKLRASKILVFIAPTKTFTGDEVAVLKQYMTKGGFVILATGYEDKDASLPLLKEFDVDIQHTPLGPVPYIEGNTSAYQNEPRFVDSWPLTFNQSHSTSYYNFTWGETSYHLVVFVKQGSGGLVVISDSQYLLDKNIESIYDYWPGNIIFLKHLFDQIKTGEETR
jgi:hypothetical protein